MTQVLLVLWVNLADTIVLAGTIAAAGVASITKSNPLYGLWGRRIPTDNLPATGYDQR